MTKFGGDVSAGIPALGRILDLNAKLKAARTVTVNFYDVHIQEFALPDLGAIRDLLGPKCREYVSGNVRTANAYQISAVLQATVDVTVEMNADVSVAAKAAFVARLAALGLTFSADQTATLKGKALFYGVRLQPIEVLTPPKEPAVASLGLPHAAPRIAGSGASNQTGRDILAAAH